MAKKKPRVEKRGNKVTVTIDRDPIRNPFKVPANRPHHTRDRDVATGRSRKPKHKGRAED